MKPETKELPSSPSTATVSINADELAALKAKEDKLNRRKNWRQFKYDKGNSRKKFIDEINGSTLYDPVKKELIKIFKLIEVWRKSYGLDLNHVIINWYDVIQVEIAAWFKVIFRLDERTGNLVLFRTGVGGQREFKGLEFVNTKPALSGIEGSGVTGISAIDNADDDIGLGAKPVVIKELDRAMVSVCVPHIYYENILVEPSLEQIEKVIVAAQLALQEKSNFRMSAFTRLDSDSLYL